MGQFVRLRLANDSREVESWKREVPCMKFSSFSPLNSPHMVKEFSCGIGAPMKELNRLHVRHSCRYICHEVPTTPRSCRRPCDSAQYRK